MPLDEADRRALEEMERALLEADPDLARSLTARRTGPPLSLAAPVVGAVMVFLAALGVFAVLTGSALPALLAVPPAAVALLLLYRPQTFSSAPPDPLDGAPDDRPPSTSSS